MKAVFMCVKQLYVRQYNSGAWVKSALFTLRQLEYFTTVAEEGSLVAAAERCHVTASALALALDELERRLSLQLFIRRKGRGVELSPAGARLLSPARQVLTEAAGFVDEAAQEAAGLTGRFVVGCFPTLAPFLLPRVIDGLARDHPNLAVEFAEGTAPELEERLLHGRADVALLYRVDVPGTLTFDVLSEFRPHVIVAADHPLATRHSLSLAELAGEPLIQVDIQPSRQNTELMFARAGLSPDIRYTTTNYELARSLVGRGLGYSVLVQRPKSSVTYDGHRISSVEILDDVASTVVGLARPAGSPMTAKYRALRHILGTSRASR